MKTGNKATPSSEPIQGSHEFRFEFKARNGVLNFIRYHEGERELVMTNKVFYGLSPRDEWGKLIERELRVYVGVTKYVIERAILTACD